MDTYIQIYPSNKKIRKFIYTFMFIHMYDAFSMLFFQTVYFYIYFDLLGELIFNFFILTVLFTMFVGVLSQGKQAVESLVETKRQNGWI